jgi:hypothetical protein
LFRRGTKRKDGVPFNPARHSAQTRHAYKGDGLVANLESDIIGRVNRLALRPTEKNALMPLMEAVSNSVHSITDLYNDESAKGQIVVRLIRNGGDPDGRVVGFDVEDNGIGFTDDNFKSFRTPDSRWKETRGGKGVGRLAGC